MANGPTDGSPDPEVDPIAEILAGATEQEASQQEHSATTSASSSEAQTAQAGQQAKQASIKLGGREYPSLTEADKAHRNLYGKYSESQGVLKWIKSNLKNPQAIAELAKLPGGQDIVAKLGLQQAQEEVEAAEAAEKSANQGFDAEKLPPQMRQLYEEMELREYRMQLRDEEREFQEELGRKIAVPEHNAVMEMLERAPSLSFKEAWTLVNHDKVLSDAVKKAQAGRPQTGNRPPPVPGLRSVPGVHLDLKKDPRDMSNDEFREYWKNSPEFQNLIKRG
jgi:hypothetical protein